VYQETTRNYTRKRPRGGTGLGNPQQEPPISTAAARLAGAQKVEDTGKKKRKVTEDYPVSKGVYFMGVHLIGMHLIDVNLVSVYHIDMHPINVRLYEQL
jgi:hypothetical protein